MSARIVSAEATAQIVSIARAIQFGATRRIETRVEAFNLFSWNYWGNLVTQITSANVGRILPVGKPCIMQFAVNYQF